MLSLQSFFYICLNELPKIALAHEKIISKFRGTYLRQAALVYFLFPCSCTFKSAELICTELKHCQETATAGGDMLLSKQSRAPLAAVKSTAYADFGAQAFLGADLVIVSS